MLDVTNDEWLSASMPSLPSWTSSFNLVIVAVDDNTYWMLKRNPTDHCRARSRLESLHLFDVIFFEHIAPYPLIQHQQGVTTNRPVYTTLSKNPRKKHAGGTSAMIGGWDCVFLCVFKDCGILKVIEFVDHMIQICIIMIYSKWGFLLNRFSDSYSPLWSWAYTGCGSCRIPGAS